MTGLASAVLGPAGVHTLYGDGSSRLPVVAAPSGIAGVLARAHQAVRNSPAGVVTDGVIEIPGHGAGQVVTIDRRSDTGDLVARVRAAIRAGGVRLELGVDPDGPWPTPSHEPGPDSWLVDLADTAAVIAGAGRVVILAGPGVVREGQVAGLHALATVLGCGVLNTWGAKGIFHWRSRHHWATIGLQDRDFELGGVHEADLLVAVGIDEREAPPSAWSASPHIVIEPGDLGPLAEMIPSRALSEQMPPIRTRLAAATQAGWQSSAVPIPPSLATRHYSQQLTPGGFIAADAGTAGFWVARTFGTTELGSVAVPPFTVPSWAVAAVTVARLADPLRPCLAVVDALDDTGHQVLDFARSRGVGVGVEVWSAEADPLSAPAHEARLADLTDPRGPTRVETVATDARQLDAFLEAAGPVRSWSPPAPAA